MRTVFALAAAALLAAVAGPAPCAVMVKQVPVMRFSAETTINVSPALVWPHLTVGRNLASWCPEWKSAGNARRVMTRVGDVLDFTDQFGNAGRSVVTYLVPRKELRVTHEPNDGSYMCQAKITLKPVGAGTLVSFQEQYTDESPEKDREATTRKMQEETEHALAALKASVERK